MSAYVSLDSGPKTADEIDGPEQLYIVIVDNGRSDFYADPKAREVLRCIRCGACLGSCPVYTKIGGYPYGWAYSGPIGQLLNPLLLGLDKTAELYRASTLCGNCKNVCPVGIDHPGLFLYFRSIDVQKDSPFKSESQPWQESIFFAIWVRIVSRISLWNLFRKLTRLFVNHADRINNFIRTPGLLEKWHKTRDLPNLPEKTFLDRWKHLNSEVGIRPSTGSDESKVKKKKVGS